MRQSMLDAIPHPGATIASPLAESPYSAGSRAPTPVAAKSGCAQDDAVGKSACCFQTDPLPNLGFGFEELRNRAELFVA